ncbi:MAG: stage III sporulation AC/AD family protein [Lachnospiraceae bacterium]|nr:stage III sporulation AC/AD family protein [Lachnospiraceae bacterium]
MDIVKIIAFAFCGLIAVILLKSVKSEYGLWVGVALACILAVYVLGYLAQILSQVEDVWTRLAGSTQLLSILIRVIGISYLCEITAALCRENGCQALAGQVVLAGKLGILFTGFPVLMELIYFIMDLGE